MFTQSLPKVADVVVIGAGLVGACCGYELAARGLSVAVVDRGAVAAGTTASGEGGLLVSDKHPGPSLELAALSLRRWRELPDALTADPGTLGLTDTGGLVVARNDEAAKALRTLAAEQRGAGVAVEDIDPARAAELEPGLTPDLAGAARYPDDAQVRPVLAATALLNASADRGAAVLASAEVTGISTEGQGLAVRTAAGTIRADSVVIAAGPWSERVARMLDRALPVTPRQGLSLVTEPAAAPVRHRVHDAQYLVEADTDEGPVSSSAATMVEPTRSGGVLISSVRRYRGYGSRVPVSAVRALAAGAVDLFPGLAGVQALHTHSGSRPCTRDHLPVIGADPDVSGLWYATGHGSDGVGLAPGTGVLLAELLTGTAPSLDPAPYAPGRPGLSGDAGQGPPDATPPGPASTFGPGSTG